MLWTIKVTSLFKKELVMKVVHLQQFIPNLSFILLRGLCKIQSGPRGSYTATACIYLWGPCC